MSESFGDAMQRIQSLTPISPEEIHRLAQGILMMGMERTESREVSPGVWEHTFTPHPLDELIRAEPTTTENTLTAADIDAILEQMHANARTDPEMLYVDRHTRHLCIQAVAQGKRNHRTWLRRKRQRRVAQRRHNRGLR